MRAFIFGFLCLLMLPFSAIAEDSFILLKCEGPIGPATADYLQTGIQNAEKAQAKGVIISMNTPGGLETSMRQINEAIMASKIPVITYVSPKGARAASAGTFIAYASHFVYMAPGTNIGAASPVSLVGEKGKESELSTHQKKAVNDASAYIRSLAQMRGRSADWAQKAVENAVSLSAQEALKLHVINGVANNLTDVLHDLNGKTFTIEGKTQTLDTQKAVVETILPNWRYQFLSILTNPNIAYLLLLAALYGLFFEFSNPGLILPGVIGAICFLLVLYAFQWMPINWVGLGLIALGIGFMVLELFVTSFGMLGVGGVIAFIIGSVMLFDTQAPEYDIAFSLLVVMSAVSAGFFLMVIWLAFQAKNKQIVSSDVSLIGQIGVATFVTQEELTVKVQGEFWRATYKGYVGIGQKVRITGIHNLILEVEPVQTEAILHENQQG